MAGHSKWANIQHRKGRQDAKRGRIFTKLIKEITVAARMGGGDVNFNPRLRLAVDNAKAENMPGENIERAIKRGTGELEGVNYEEARYEGYGIGGAAVMVDCLTDNKTRTVNNVRHLFDKCGGSMGNSGCVSYMFKKQGTIVVDAKGLDEDDLMLMALDAGAEDVVNDEDVYEIVTAPADFSAVREKLEQQGLTFLSAEVQKIPQNTVAVTDPDTILKIQKMLDLLEENDDVQNVFHNADLPEEEEEE